MEGTKILMQNENRTSFFYFKRRFLKNKPALFGLVIILMAVAISVLGYAIMPDSTTNANNSLPEIKKQGIGFEVDILRVKKNVAVREVSFFESLAFGQESQFIEKPLDSIQYQHKEGMLRIYLAQGRGILYEDLFYADVLYALTGDVTVDGEASQFKDLEGQIGQELNAKMKAQIEESSVFRRTYLLGTDSSGRDLMSRLLFGTRVSLMIGLVTVIVALLIGVFLGGIAGYFGGWVDDLVMWFMTVIWSIPRIMLVIVIGMALQSNGLWVAFVAVGLTMWTEVARVVRGKILEVRERQYITAAKVLGLGNMRIIFGHILPNILGSVVVIATANFADAILIEAGLSFLGLGVPPPVPSWGQMVNEGFNLITNPECLHLILFPSLAICLLVLSFNLLGNGLRDALDPKN